MEVDTWSRLQGQRSRSNMQLRKKLVKSIKNKIAQGDVAIFSHLTLLEFVYVFFIDFTQNFSSNRLNIIKFVFYGSELVEINTLLARFQNFQFSRQNFDFLLNAVLSITGSYQSILLIFNSKHRNTTRKLVSKFEENRTKIATVRVPQRKNAKWPPWRHQIRNFKNREKLHWQISVR